MDLAVVIPFHNEERCLPVLIGALRKQTAEGVPIVFVDNASTDRSAALVRQTEEVRLGKWTCLVEPQVGKMHAVRMATAYCRERFDARHIGFLDSDSHPLDGSWLARSLEIIDRAGGQLGFTYSPLHYVGFDAFPTFKRAYLAHQDVQHELMRAIGWLANGQGFVCSTATASAYFAEAELTTEFDLRTSLLALRQGRQAHLNPAVIVTSGRRIVGKASNFAAWCFYDREYYSKKDINASTKLPLDDGEPAADLSPQMIRRFFDRRAVKMAARHILPLAIFDGSSRYFDRIRVALGVDVEADLSESAARFRRHASCLFTNEFDHMIQLVEDTPAMIAVAGQIARRMNERFEQVAAPAIGSHAV